MSVRTTPIDEAKLMEFVGKAVGDLGATFHAGTILVGEKVGLDRALADAGPATSTELASASPWKSATCASG
jgi:hypothetical protein